VQRRIVNFWVLLLLTLATGSALAALATDSLPTVELATGCAALSFVMAFAHTLARSPGGLVSLPCGYLGLLGLFHLGLIVPACLGYAPPREARWLFSSTTPKALLLCVVAFAAFSVGTAVAGLRAPRRPLPGAIAQHSRGLLIGGVVLGLVGTALLTAGAFRIGMLDVLYREFFAVRELEDPRLFGIGYMFATMGMVIAGVGANRAQLRIVGLASVIVLGPLFLYGFRGHLIVYFIALLMIWHRKDRRMARQVAVAGLVLVLLLSPAVRLLRAGGTESLTEALSSVGALDLLTEAGGSLRPLVETVDALDYDNVGYWYGASYAAAFTRIVPNASPKWSAPESRNERDPASWITARVEPLAQQTGGGIGYSGIAEPYLNFGPMGVLLFFLLLGFVLARLDRMNLGIHAAAVVACGYAALLWTVRNDFSNLIRPVVWGALVVGALHLISATRRARSNGTPDLVSSPSRTSTG